MYFWFFILLLIKQKDINRPQLVFLIVLFLPILVMLSARLDNNKYTFLWLVWLSPGFEPIRWYDIFATWLNYFKNEYILLSDMTEDVAMA